MKNEKYLKHLRFITLVAIIPLLFHSCTHNEINQPLASKHFFQASDFMINDYKAQRSSKQLMKIVTINQHLDTLYYRDSLKEDELILLSKFNLNNPDCIQQYKADTAFGVYGEPDRYTYKALNDKLAIRNMEVFVNQGRVRVIKIDSRRNSLINKHQQHLTYTASTGYDLISSQQMWNGDTLRMNIHGSFVSKNK